MRRRIERRGLRPIVEYQLGRGVAALAHDSTGQLFHVRGRTLEPVSLSRSVALHRRYDASGTAHDNRAMLAWFTSIARGLRRAGL